MMNVGDDGTESDPISGHSGGGSGGYLEHILRHSALSLFGVHDPELKYRTLRWDLFIYKVKKVT